MTALPSAQQEQSGFFDQFRLLTRYPNFGLLWTGQVISHIGDAFYSIALIWLVQEMTGSRTMMGAISAAVSMTALFGLVAGALVDRWDRRLTMFFSDVLRALTILTLPVLALLGQLEVWHLFVVGIVMGLLAQLFYPAKQALLPHLVSRADLTGANALSHMAFLLLIRRWLWFRRLAAQRDDRSRAFYRRCRHFRSVGPDHLADSYAPRTSGWAK